jgi:hypothetical protein
MQKSLKILFISCLWVGGFFVAGNVFAATEFVSIIDPDSGAGTDFSSLSAWEGVVQADLSTSTTKVFSYGTASGTVPDNVTVQGQLSGATATLIHQTASTTSSQILLVSISGTFLSGEQVYRQSTGASSTYIFLSNAGDSAIAVASCRSTNGTADQTAVTIVGWTTASTTYIKIWTDPATGARHNGKWDGEKYRLETLDSSPINNFENYVRVDGLQMIVDDGGYGGFYSGYGNTGTVTDLRVSDNIIRGNGTSNIHYGVVLDMESITTAVAMAWNNIIYDMGTNASSRGIYAMNSTFYVYNNTIHNGYGGIESSNGAVIKNNIVQGATNGYIGAFGSGSNYNISNVAGDTTGGANDKGTTTVSFIDSVNKDFHLSPSDTAAKNAGTSTPLWDVNLSFTQDIDGSYRGAAWDIGADEVPTEFVSTICEAGATNCSVTADYHTLSPWENAHEIDLTAPTTRVFSGFITGTMAKASYSNVYVGGADTGITVTMEATTTAGQILVDYITGTTTPLTVASGTEFRESGDPAHMWTVTGTGDQLGASPAAVAKIDGSWANPDTTAVVFYGWKTSKDNYAKIYTTPTARHSGKWDTGKYRLEISNSEYGVYPLNISANFVKVDGLQAKIINGTGNWHIGINMAPNDASSTADYEISNNIIQGSFTANLDALAGISFNSGYTSNAIKAKIWNNIIYGFSYGTNDAAGIDLGGQGSDMQNLYFYAFNNTVYDNYYGFTAYTQSAYNSLKNNIAVNNTTDYNLNGAMDETANNLSSDATSPDTSLRNKTVQFVDAASNDFHLADTDTSAKGAGVNLYSDANINVTNDIDSAGRPNSTNIGLPWDIGADQTAVKIYRSIAPSATGVLTTGASNALTISSSTSLATFATALADNIGVGDVIIYNTGGTATGTAFIHGRSSSTVYTVKTASGTLPIAVSADTSWSIYRSYTTLANAEAGTENTGIPAAIRNFDAWSGGADLVASNTQMNIAAYANGTTADTDGFWISDWIVGQQNFIKIYTPTLTSEVGTSQRHQGKWDNAKYRLEVSQTNAIDSFAKYTRIDGLQVKVTASSGGTYRGIYARSSADQNSISNNIVRGVLSGSAEVHGIDSVVSVYIWNNVVYDFMNSSVGGNAGIVGDGGTSYFYNNTIYNSYLGLWKWSGEVIAKNNIVKGSGDSNAYVGTFASETDYNATDGTDDIGAGTHNKISQTFAFVDAVNKDFHLAPTDTAALDAGTSSPRDSIDPAGLQNDIIYDIDGQLRRQWDIGADEASVEYVTSVMEAGGNFSTLSAWEAANQADLATTSTAVFSLSSASGTIPANSSVMGLTSGAVASTTVGSVSTSTQILLYNIASSTFLSGERIYIKGGATTSNYAIISNAGNPAIATAKIDGAWTNPDTTQVLIDGWVTGAVDYVKVYTTATARHNGKWDNSKYRLLITSGSQAMTIYVNEAYARLEGLQIQDQRTNGYIGGISFDSTDLLEATEWQLSHNIIRGNNGAGGGTSQQMGVEVWARWSNYPQIAKVWDNLVYDFVSAPQRNNAGIWMSYSAGKLYAYNNTVINSYTGIYKQFAASGVYAYNNVVQNCNDGYYGSNYSTSFNNISDQASDAPGSFSKNSTNVIFADETNDDFHLSSTDTAAKDAGTSTIPWDASLNFTQDIDGSYRGAAWDIGADEVPTEFVSTICENASAGGSCATLDKTTLASWESDVNSDLTATSTRVFSGASTGTFADGATLTLYRGATSTGVTGVVVATTSSQILLRSIVGTTTPLNVQNGDTWQLNGSNYWTASGTLDQLGASPIAVAKIDGAWANPDTAVVYLDGWTTGADNYIKIYTTAAARHKGIWGSGYRLLGVDMYFVIAEEYVRVDGISLKTETTGYSPYFISYSNGSGEIHVSNSFGWLATSTSDRDVFDIYGVGKLKAKFWNDIGITDSTNNSSEAFFFNDADVTAYCYSCTGVANAGNAFRGGPVIIMNSIGYTTTGASFAVSGTTTYSISNDATADDLGGAGNKINQTISFVDATNKDFHLAETDTSAKGAGINLYSDANINVINDIDSAIRPATSTIGLAWDIGADQTAVKIYRSIAPGLTAALTTGASNAMTISSSTSLATFATALADNIGVGDVIIYNTGGTATSTAFIHGRSSSTVYTVKTASGTLPTAVAADTSWSIYRAYTSLSNAEAGTENTGIANATIRNFDAWSGGADLVASNTQMNIAAYANGTTADTASTIINNWTTGQQNYIKVYTPVGPSEVGISQRHTGKWDNSKYKNENSVWWDANIEINSNYVLIDGLQLSKTNTGGSCISTNANHISVKNSFINGGTGANNGGIGLNYVGKVDIYNNIILSGYQGISIGGTPSDQLHIVNNTIYVDSGNTGIYSGDIMSKVYLFNNLVQGSGTNYDIYWTPQYHANNISFDNSSPDSGSTDCGGHSCRSQTVAFVDTVNRDLHLASFDTIALDAGTSTPATDSNLSFTDDIDGQLRRQWDIGADEGSVEYVTSVMEANGNFSTLSAWEAANQVDLATTSTAVFSLSSATGTIPVNSSVVGLTSGAVASTTVGLVSTSTQILLYNIASSTFLSGERIYISGGATTSNYAILSNAGNPAIATAKIDGAWTGSVGAVTINGWTAGPTNYIRIYTIPAARHQGKWDTSRFRIETATKRAIALYEDYTWLDGLQIHVNSGSYYSGIEIFGSIIEAKISNNIIQGNDFGIRDGSTAMKVWNNIFYDMNYAAIYNFGTSQDRIYNNTFRNNGTVLQMCGLSLLKNNLFSGNDRDVYNCSPFSNGTDYNITDNSSLDDYSVAGGGNSHDKVSQTFVFVDAANNDFHLAPTDTAAKDAGADLSADANLPFATDIDGQYRGAQATTSAGGLGWDIGADEGATIMHRSVGNYTGDLNSGGAVVTITNSTSSSLATFDIGLPTNVGVGDVIQYGSPLSLAFITGRSSSTVYSIINATGTYPIATTSAAASIYRAHTLLNNWQTQTTATVNQSINAGLRSQVLVARNLVASNTAMFVAAYASSSPDTTATNIQTWTTGAGNYVKIYTPFSSTEVGVTQRHSGKWDDVKFKMEITGSNQVGVLINTKFARIDGLQIKITSSNQNGNTAIAVNNSTSSEAIISSNIIRGIMMGTANWNHAIDVEGPDRTIKIWNNMFYGFSLNTNVAVYTTLYPISYIYNNTALDSYRCYYNNTGGAGSGTMILKNNIAKGCTDGFAGGQIDAASDYNISDLAGDAPGSHSKNSTVVNFVDASNGDFHLAPTDRAARDAGVDLSADPYLPFTIDIDGEARPQGPAWDIGADEAIDAPEYQMEGKIQFEGKIKFW